MSTRMGSDKGLLATEGKQWFVRNFKLLKNFFRHTVISIRKEQLLSYQIFLPSAEYIEDLDNGINGPLRGIASVHNIYPNSDLFVLACDMIQMNENSILNLLSEYKASTDYDFYLYKNEDYIETLCGVYTARGLQKIYFNLKSNSGNNFSLQKNILNLNPLLLSIPPENKNAFVNFNSHNELESDLFSSNM